MIASPGHELWSEPRRLIRHLADEQHLPSTAVDWEGLLTENYTRYLRPGCSIIDVGAHRGLHAERFLEHLAPRHLVLVEPIPEAAEALRGRFGGSETIEVREVALGRSEGPSSFVINEHAPAQSGLRRRAYHDEADARLREIHVRTEHLDSWTFDGTVDYVKIDVEGGEVDVLRGATGLLATHRPFVSVEYGRPSYAAYGHDADTLFDLARAAEYTLVDLFGNALGDRETWRACVDSYYWDFMLVPSERLEATETVRGGIRRAGARWVRAASRRHRLRRLLRPLGTLLPRKAARRW